MERHLFLQLDAIKSFNWTMEPRPLYSRFAEIPLQEALADSPAVLVHGPRQSGKTTLVHSVGEPMGYRFISFDDGVARVAAESDPVGFVAGLPERIILDEVQRVPSLFTSLRQEIDRHRIPGRFLLTGSSQVLLLPIISDSLAGRLEILHLHPLSLCEMDGGIPNFLDDLFFRGFGTSTTDRFGDELAVRIASGGYPAALTRPTARRRASWAGFLRVGDGPSGTVDSPANGHQTSHMASDLRVGFACSASPIIGFLPRYLY